MKFDDRMGMAYDTIFFGDLSYNFEYIKNNLQKSYGLDENDFYYYYQLKDIMPEPPPELYPLYYKHRSKYSFMLGYYYSNFKFGIQDFSEFLNELLDNSKSFQQAIIQHYFDDALNEDIFNKSSIKLLVQKLLHLDLEHDVILALINIVVNFDSVKKTIKKYLIMIYTEIQKLHCKEKAHIDRTLKIYMEKDILHNFNTIETFDYEKTSPRDKISISLLNVLIVLQKGDFKSGYKFVLGWRSHEYIDIRQNYYKVTPQVICSALGDPTKITILKYLNQNEFTCTQLSDMIHMARQTVIRHVNWLLDNLFIKVSRKNGMEIYYRVNNDFFSVAKNVLLQYVKEFESENEEGEISE